MDLREHYRTEGADVNPDSDAPTRKAGVQSERKRLLSSDIRVHYSEIHWANTDKRYRSDKQVEEWHDQEHNEDAWFFRTDHTHEVTVKESRRGKR